MPEQVTNYQCPACGGPLHFVGASGKLECDYCDSKFDVSEIEALYQEKNAKAEDAFHGASENDAIKGWDDSDLTSWGLNEGMKAYSCPSCGAELICEETTSATSCPYCGNPTVVPGQFAGGLKPDYIIPFKLNQDQAQSQLRNFYRGKKFLPKVFSSENQIKEIKGIYVPFWLYDGTADADVNFEAQKIHQFRSGNYRVTETEVYDVHRAGTVPFEKIPVDASKKMPNEYMDAVEPFDYGELTTFSTAYLPGFLADRYDEDAKECAKRADLRAENTAVEMMQTDVKNYDRVKALQKNVYLQRGKVHYALLPVYLLNTKWNGEEYLFAMNGQTGKFIGNLPIDKKKNRLYFWSIALTATFIIGTIFMKFL